MVFWRKKKNIVEQEQDDRDQELLHPDDEPGIEPSTDYDVSLSDDAIQVELRIKDNDIIDELVVTPLPDVIPEIVKDVTEEPDIDHTQEGGWFSRMSKGLSKSSAKLTQGLSDIITKSKLDQEALDRLEDVLIEADLGPKTASRLIEEFSKDRFGKDISEYEIKEALAQSMAKILEPVAQPLTIEKQKRGPYVILVCGVNGAGKTTTIGKYTQQLQRDEGRSVMIVAADTFRAAAIEQLGEWARRSGAVMFSKDVGSDAASVAYEAYEEAVKNNIDVLLIDTAGRLQNKANLMAELEKIVRVLKKKDENLPHATLLVLDSTTGQNAYSQVDAFKKMVDVTGLIVTKLDGSAKGGVLIGLADQFGVPVHAIGVGETIDDLKAFTARDYARSLMGLES
ncbi:MAG: signal recognition particle-docking protein FtsY [Zetaproteobacteria bacterium]|nr:MAG: signal recognition particle-docking protein FtsY [Zetaproteobacteria bacterium]